MARHVIVEADFVSFDAAWTRFSTWLAEHAAADHARLRPPAEPEDIADFEAELGFALHPDLKALLLRHDGADAAFLPLGHQLVSVEEIAEEHWSLADVSEDGPWDESEVMGHAHQWVELARSIDGGLAFVDHRPGPTYGHVYEIGLGSGAAEPTLWGTSPADAFDSLANALEGGAPFASSWRPVAEGGDDDRRLTWEISVGDTASA